MTAGVERPYRRTPHNALEVLTSLACAHVVLTGEPAQHGAIVLVGAQSALETGWWSHSIDDELDGQKWLGVGDYCVYRTTEGSGASARTSEQRFRAFASLDEASLACMTELRDRFPAAWAVLPSGEATAYVDALHREGYFSGDLAAYRAGVAAIAHELAAVPFDVLGDADRVRALALVGVTLACESPS